MGAQPRHVVHLAVAEEMIKVAAGSMKVGADTDQLSEPLLCLGDMLTDTESRSETESQVR